MRDLDFMRDMVRIGAITPAEATGWLLELGILKPGERRAANGVIIGSGAEPDIPRFGADENDLDCVTGDPG